MHEVHIASGVSGSASRTVAGGDRFTGGGTLKWKIVAAGVCVCVAAVLFAVQVPALLGHRLPQLTDSAIQDAERLWEQSRPASYDMRVEISGAQPGAVTVSVRNGAVAAMTRDGRTPPERTWDVWTVPGMFETLEREVELAADPVQQMGAATGTQLHLRCEFDARFGYPRRYHRFVNGGGPEVYWQVASFEPQ